MLKLLIITDDFTGALDTGIQFTKQGVKIQIAVEQNPENISISDSTQVSDCPCPKTYLYRLKKKIILQRASLWMLMWY